MRIAHYTFRTLLAIFVTVALAACGDVVVVDSSTDCGTGGSGGGEQELVCNDGDACTIDTAIDGECRHIEQETAPQHYCFSCGYRRSCEALNDGEQCCINGTPGQCMSGECQWCQGDTCYAMR